MQNLITNFTCPNLFPDNLGEDCPVFENLFEFCQIYAGGTIGNESKTRVLLKFDLDLL